MVPLRKAGARRRPWDAPEQHDGLRVLLVEDNADSTWSLALLLGLDGHTVEAAADGPAALRAARRTPPDVVLLDIGLPGMDGYEVARRLGEQAGAKRPLLVAVTGFGTDDDRRRSRDAGIDLHLVKPVDPGQLRRLLGRFQRIIA